MNSIILLIYIDKISISVYLSVSTILHFLSQWYVPDMPLYIVICFLDNAFVIFEYGRFVFVLADVILPEDVVGHFWDIANGHFLAKTAQWT